MTKGRRAWAWRPSFVGGPGRVPGGLRWAVGL